MPFILIDSLLLLAVESSIEVMRDTLHSLIDIESLINTIKTNPPNKVQLWEIAKCQCFTRTLAAINAIAITSAHTSVLLAMAAGRLANAESVGNT